MMEGIQVDKKKGGIYLVTGCMFSGKTNRLIEIYNDLCSFGGMKGQFFTRDTRYEGKIRSHSESTIHDASVTVVKDVAEAQRQLKKRVKVVAFDEVQMLEAKVVDFIQDLCDTKRIVLCAGLDKDYLDRWFRFSRGNSKRTMEELWSLAYGKEFHAAVCQYRENGAVCGWSGLRNATRTQRLMPDESPVPHDDPLVLEGDEKVHPQNKRSYAARCPRHHLVKYFNEVLTVDQLRKTDPTALNKFF